MTILIVAATIEEITPLLSEFKLQAGTNNCRGNKIGVLITGVGMTATAFALGTEFAGASYDLAINLGIAGSFDQSVELGKVVRVAEDCFAELGAENDATFISIDKLGFGQSVYREKLPANIQDFAPVPVKSITVNKVHGNDQSIEQTLTRLHPQIESMEGAAFFYACDKAGIDCLQVRAISNYVEKRNRDNWKIGLAVKNLNIFATKFLTQILH
ncbi:futalosine hydrolase [Pedobacter sp. HMF7647]|uniref:Futalosine hydrolase n=1 Tax=Hufsiella arboris TaxID=2695275 RepID=A0A7K1Y4P0_9SPHI|nr:futalosine hydrolase [Hufsiella arboris]MXV49542.1 futalosine hydrolase [Hufsiella arboris]